MTRKTSGRGADNHHDGIWPLFARYRAFSKADGLSYGWTGGVYIAAKPRRAARGVMAGENDKPTTGPHYEIKLKSLRIGMLLA